MMTVRRMTVNDSYESMKIELDQVKKQLLQKDTENQELRRKVFAWKKAALENESLYQTARQQSQIQEQNLIARHNLEMDALTAAHVEKLNEVSNTIILLQQSQDNTGNRSSKHVDDLLEDKHKETASKITYNRQKANDLILNMNELMTEIETKIQGYVHGEVHPNNVNEDGQIYSTTTDRNADNIYCNDQISLLNEPMKTPQAVDTSLSPLYVNSDYHHHYENTTRPFSSSSSTSFHDSYSSSLASSCSSVSIELNSHRDRLHPTSRLKTKQTMEHLTKVIPNFLMKNVSNKSEQWKVTRRRSFINDSS